LSLWVCDDIQDIELVEFPLLINCAKSHENPHFKTYCVKKSSDDKISGTKPVDTILSSDPLNFKYSSLPYKLQTAIARFLRLIITGSVGQLPPIPIAISQQTPTGFNLSHMNTLLTFIQFIAR
jgi:hypothetical protein